VDGFSTAISGIGSAVGRYFSVVSFIPSLLLTGFTFLLIQSGAWNRSGNLDWAAGGNAFTRIGDLALLTLISVALGIAFHPIQFALVQFFEGYWGTGGMAQRIRVSRILRHRDRFLYLRNGPGPEATLELKEAAKKGMPFEGKARFERISISEESRRMAGAYPAEEDDVMPTRLGNVLRRHERLAGSQYGLEAATVIRHIALVAPPQRLGYLNDQRQLLDLSVRMSATSILATLIAVAALWRHGPWLLIALVPYGIAYISYRGAVVVAGEYGSAFSTIIDLDRFAFYDQLRLPPPKDTEDERIMNSGLVKLLSHKRRTLVYAPPPTTEGVNKDPKAT
jgi:hypothetical protein